MGMNGCGMTMNGRAASGRSRPDCNNYLDSRDERHVNDQVRAYRPRFDRGDTLSARYSLSSENGFMPINLPAWHLPRRLLAKWQHLLDRIAAAHGERRSLSVSRLSMITPRKAPTSTTLFRSSAFSASASADPEPRRSVVHVQGYSGMGDTYAATPMRAWTPPSKAAIF